jgi:hypothetical protein
MIMHRCIRPLVFVLLSALVTPATAEQNPAATIDAATKLAQWFNGLIRPFAELGATAERQRLVDSLVALNRDLFNLQQEKRYLVVALKRRPLNMNELAVSQRELSGKLTSLRDSITRVAPQLRLAYRAGANEPVALISEALSSKAGIVRDLDSLTESTADLQGAEAELAVKALEEAQVALANAIVAIQK